LHLQRRIAIPTVSLNCQFTCPSRLGDSLVARLRVERIGKSSVTLQHRLSARNDGENLRLSAQHVIVFVDMGSMVPIEIPNDLSSAMSPFLVSHGVRDD
jgi:4-hydroxybenzoyl-CoA thioesterase